jgi:hypothetical protein
VIPPLLARSSVRDGTREQILVILRRRRNAAGIPVNGAGQCLVLGGPLTDPGGMSDSGLTVSGMTEPPIRYDVTVTVARDTGCDPDPSEFAVAAERAALRRNAHVMSAHTCEKTVSIVTVEAPSQSSALAVALAVVAEALRRRVVSSSR